MIFILSIISILVLPILNALFVRIGLGGVFFAFGLVIKRKEDDKIFAWIVWAISAVIYDSVHSEFFAPTVFIMVSVLIIREVISKFVDLKELAKNLICDFLLLLLAHGIYERFINGSMQFIKYAIISIIIIFASEFISTNRRLKIR